MERGIFDARFLPLAIIAVILTTVVLVVSLSGVSISSKAVQDDKLNIRCTSTCLYGPSGPTGYILETCDKGETFKLKDSCARGCIHTEVPTCA